MKCIQYVQHTKPSSSINIYFPFPDNLKTHIFHKYIEPGKLIKENISNELTSTNIFVFNNVDDMYEYNTDPVMASWRISYNEFLVTLGVTTVQGAGYYES